MNAGFDFDSVVSILESAARLAAIPRVFPRKIATVVRDALCNPANKLGERDDDYPGAQARREIETIGDCRYAISITDAHGTRYRVIIEVDDRKAVSA